ncbi:MAG: 4Fe-4S dicluster domain-containing protein [Lachnospiraceae bacterium]|nr:4Fe-4S dicluster domain-containing protein [Lachnospiraceae bacterium]
MWYRYCCDGCPAKIKIPDVFNAVNTLRKFPDDMRPILYYNGLTAESGKASSCLKCGQCEGVCPQHLPIIKYLEEASEKLEGKN